MKKIVAVMLGLLLLAIWPVVAADPVWKHGDKEILFAGSVIKNQATGDTDVDMTGALLHYATDRSQVGVSTSFSKRGSDGGAGVGPAYYWNLPRMKKGNFFLGGSAEILTGDVSDLAKAKAATEFGYRLYVGSSSALRVAAHVVKALDPESDATADEIDNVGLVFGFSMGINSESQVQ